MPCLGPGPHPLFWVFARWAICYQGLITLDFSPLFLVLSPKNQSWLGHLPPQRFLLKFLLHQQDKIYFLGLSFQPDLVSFSITNSTYWVGQECHSCLPVTAWKTQINFLASPYICPVCASLSSSVFSDMVGWPNSASVQIRPQPGRPASSFCSFL